MRKLLLPILICLSMVAYSASVSFKWNPAYAPQVNGLPPVAIKLYYGSQLKTYTNFIVAPITNLTATPYNGYDQYNCVTNTVVNYVTIPIYGLGLSNQIFTAYSVINERGEESPLINEATCGFTITNRMDKPLPPDDLKVR